MKENILVSIIIVVNFIFLIFGANSISISANEAEFYYHGNGLLFQMVHFFTSIFGENDLALRLPFIIFHLISLVLIYKIGKLFLKRKLDRVLSVTIYALLPGINSAALLVNPTSIVIFLTLLFIYFYLYDYKRFAYFILLFSLFIDNSFSILYLSLFFYGLSKREKPLIFLGLILFGISMYMFGFDDGGKPRGYFVDTLGIYAAIFSPFLFLYYVYTIYRILIKEEKNILWYISFIPFIFSMILSLRQKIYIEDFAPFVVLGVPLMVRVFFNSYRVRLPIHRRVHKKTAIFVLTILIFSTFFSFINKPLYPLFKNYKKHFAYRYHIAKELASKLKQKGYHKVLITDRELADRLRFYGILQKGAVAKLKTKEKNQKPKDSIKIVYYGTKVGEFFIY